MKWFRIEWSIEGTTGRNYAPYGMYNGVSKIRAKDHRSAEIRLENKLRESSRWLDSRDPQVRFHSVKLLKDTKNA